jgi:putative transposase
MRREPFKVGNYIHVFNRGNRKMPIVYDEKDKWRFLKILRYFNDYHSPENIFRQLAEFHKSCRSLPFTDGIFWPWPSEWPEHNPLVKILCFCLMPNHFHLLLKEIVKGGISKFMLKLGTGFTNYLNIKYGEVGRVFQGPYKAKTIEKIEHLQYLNVYIQILNPLELYPDGLEAAKEEFDKVFEFAMNYKFGSLSDFLADGIWELSKKIFLKRYFQI